MRKTQLFGVRDPGRSGGSFLMHIINRHPAGMSVLGELHMPSQLNFEYPCSTEKYDEYGIAFLQSQIDQGRAAAGIVKCFWNDAVAFIRGHGGHIIQLVRNPMEVAGTNMYRKIDVDYRFLGRKAKNMAELFRAHLLYYQLSYSGFFNRRIAEPIVRIEDLNRSCGGDGAFIKVVMEHITQTEFSPGYVKHIQKYYLPGYHYGCHAIKENRIVVGIEPGVYPYEKWRMSWGDDPRPGEYWNSWTAEEQGMARDILGPISEKFGYNCTDRPGYTETGWLYSKDLPWSAAALGLVAIPYTSDVETRQAYPYSKENPPDYREENA